MSYLEPLMRRNFLEYASYVIVDRAIPDIRDGCKPVQRRILNTLFEVDDGRFHKVANVIGETMKLHPHGDASIGDALVVLANKEYFIERQGNFGNIFTGHSGGGGALHRVPSDAAGARDAVQQEADRVAAELRRTQAGADLPAGQAAGDPDARHRGHRRGHGDTHPAAQLRRAAAGADQPAEEGRDLPPARLPPGRTHGRRRVRRRRRQGAGARVARGGQGQEDHHRPRDPVLDDHREPDRLHRDGGAEGQAQGLVDRGPHRRACGDRAVAAARHLRRRGGAAALGLYPVRAVHQLQHRRHPGRPPRRADGHRGAHRPDEAAQGADQGRIGAGTLRAGGPPALPDAGADLHREPRLQAHRDGEDVGGSAFRGLRGHGAVLGVLHPRDERRRRRAPAEDPASAVSPSTTSRSRAERSTTSSAPSRTSRRSCATSPRPPSPTSTACSRPMARNGRVGP